jgi:Transmembrane domain of unknown function (DUF3566)
VSSSDDPKVWRPGPEPSSASGGHVAPDLQGGSLFDPLDAPLPSELERQRLEAERQRDAERPPIGAPPPPRTDVIPREDPQRRARRSRPIMRRTKRTLRHIDPLSLLKLSLFFYAVFFVLWLLFVAVVYWFASNTVVTPEGRSILELITEVQDAFGVENPLDLTLMGVERVAFLIGLTFVVVGSILNVFVAFLYNVAADVLGGVEMTFQERDV